MKRKVGLVLGGGGGKGSYQVGVYKALKEYGLVKSIKGISGASIGSLNMLLFYNKDVETAEKVWMNLRRKDVLTTKSFKDYLKLSNFSLLSREGMLNIFKEHINFELIGKSKMDLYVSVSNVTENKGEYFSLKNKTSDEIINIVSASSAIPYVFEQVKIGNNKYVDGYLYDNLPISILKEKGYNFLYVIPLSSLHAPKEGMYEDITIVNFQNKIFDSMNRIEGTFGFSGEISEDRIELGYNDAKKLIEKLILDGVITPNFKTKIRKLWLRFTRKYKEKKFYSYEDL